MLNWLDTARVARRTWDAVARKGYGLANLASMLGIEFKHHDALEDAKATGLVAATQAPEPTRHRLNTKAAQMGHCSERWLFSPGP